MSQLFRTGTGFGELRLPGILPDDQAPILRRRADGDRELVRARWGMPTPRAFVTGPIDRGVANIRNPDAPYWRRWLLPEFRCLVPASSFCEPRDASDPATGKKRQAWFALGRDRPLFAFAGIWCDWNGIRGTLKRPEVATHRLYGILTTTPNVIVKQIRSRTMPVILTTPEECDLWLSAEPAEALKLQRPLPEGKLMIVGKGEMEDSGPALL